MGLEKSNKKALSQQKHNGSRPRKIAIHPPPQNRAIPEEAEAKAMAVTKSTERKAVEAAAAVEDIEAFIRSGGTGGEKKVEVAVKGGKI
jgi:hypothetical protein